MTVNNYPGPEYPTRSSEMIGKIVTGRTRTAVHKYLRAGDIHIVASGPVEAY